MKYFDLFFRDSKVFASFSNLFFSETIDWISAIQCRISIVINRVVFSPNSCLVYLVFTATIYFFKICYIENFTRINRADFFGGQLVEAFSRRRRKWMRSAASPLFSSVGNCRSLFSASSQLNAKRSFTLILVGALFASKSLEKSSASVTSRKLLLDQKHLSLLPLWLTQPSRTKWTMSST